MVAWWIDAIAIISIPIMIGIAIKITAERQQEERIAQAIEPIGREPRCRSYEEESGEECDEYDDDEGMEPLDVLKLRFAKGEITNEEYLETKRTLES